MFPIVYMQPYQEALVEWNPTPWWKVVFRHYSPLTWHKSATNIFHTHQTSERHYDNLISKQAKQNTNSIPN
jgi:hypothetical protein